MWGLSLVEVIMSHFILFSRCSPANMHSLNIAYFTTSPCCLPNPSRDGQWRRAGKAMVTEAQGTRRPFNDTLGAVLGMCKFTLSWRRKSRGSAWTDGLAEGAHTLQNQVSTPDFPVHLRPRAPRTSFQEAFGNTGHWSWITGMKMCQPAHVWPSEGF